MEAFYAEFPVDSPPSKPHQHGSAEFIYELSGSLAVHVNGKEKTLYAQDAICVDSGIPQSYRRLGSEICTALVVTHEA